MSDQTMTIGITGPRRRAPWRGAVVVLMIAAIVLSICLILLGLTGDFLVDWLWFSTIGYLGVFWTTIVAEAEVKAATSREGMSDYAGSGSRSMILPHWFQRTARPRTGAKFRHGCFRSPQKKPKSTVMLLAGLMGADHL
jgi:Uncharacterised protein family (UPF0182)